MCIFAYYTNDRKLQRKRKNETCLQNAFDKATSIFCPGPKLASNISAKLPLILTHHSWRERHMPLKIIMLEENPWHCHQTPSVRQSQGPASTVSHVAPSAPLPVDIKIMPMLIRWQWVERRSEVREFQRWSSGSLPSRIWIPGRACSKDTVKFGVDEKLSHTTWCRDKELKANYHQKRPSLACSILSRNSSRQELLPLLASPVATWLS